MSKLLSKYWQGVCVCVWRAFRLINPLLRWCFSGIFHEYEETTIESCKNLHKRWRLHVSLQQLCSVCTGRMCSTLHRTSCVFNRYWHQSWTGNLFNQVQQRRDANKQILPCVAFPFSLSFLLFSPQWSVVTVSCPERMFILVFVGIAVWNIRDILCLSWSAMCAQCVFVCDLTGWRMQQAALETSADRLSGLPMQKKVYIEK